MRSYDPQFLPLLTPGCPRSCPLSVRSPSIRRPKAYGRVAEWFKAAVLKVARVRVAGFRSVTLSLDFRPLSATPIILRAILLWPVLCCLGPKLGPTPDGPYPLRPTSAKWGDCSAAARLRCGGTSSRYGLTACDRLRSAKLHSRSRKRRALSCRHAHAGSDERGSSVHHVYGFDRV